MSHDSKVQIAACDAEARARREAEAAEKRERDIQNEEIAEEIAYHHERERSSDFGPLQCECSICRDRRLKEQQDRLGRESGRVAWGSNYDKIDPNAPSQRRND